MIIHKILRNTSLALIFLVTFIPLYVSNNLFFPFITGKAFVFRIIVEILFALWLLLILRDKKYAPKFSWISFTITLFVIAMFVMDMMGVNPLRSLWSNFERMEGWVTIIHLWAYFIVTTSIFGAGEEGRRMWHNFFKVTLFAAFCVGLYGFWQLFGWAEIHQGSTRIDASLGNAAYMAVYMLIHAFIGFYMALTAWDKRKNNLVILYGALGLIFSFLVYETATRGTILGLVGGIMLALGIYAVFGKNESRDARWISGGIIGLIILLGVSLVAAKNTNFVKSHEILNRLASISISDTTTQARGYIWPMAIKGVFSSPKTAIFGWGQENFNYIFNANYNPNMWNQEQWFDRAHNVFLDWLVAGGLIGFLLYASLFFLAVRGIWKSPFPTFKEKALLTGLVVGYAIHNIFVFDNIASYLLFFSILGFVHSITAVTPIKLLEKADVQSEEKIVMRDYVWTPLVIVLFLVTLYFVNVRPIQANTRLITALEMCTQGAGVQPSADAFTNALGLNQYVANQEIREQLLTCAGNVIGNNSMPTSLKSAFYTLSLKEISDQVKATPLDARIYTIGGIYLDSIGDFKNAAPLLEKANQLSPHKQSTIFELATNYINTGKTKQANDLLAQAYLSAPEDDNAKLGYLSTLILSGNEAQIPAVFGTSTDTLNDPRILSAYAQVKEYDKVISGYKALIAKDQTNLQYYSGLVAAYIANGQKSTAIAELEDMKSKFPASKNDIDNAITQVQSQK